MNKTFIKNVFIKICIHTQFYNQRAIYKYALK